MPRPGPNVTSDADTQPGSDSLFPTGFSGGGALVRQGSVGTGEIADGSVAAADLNLPSVAAAIAARSELTGTYVQSPDPLYKWRAKLGTSPSTARIMLVGDSTSDERTGAATLYQRLRSYHLGRGGTLEGMQPSGFGDGTSTSGSATYTSATAAFTSSDAGITISGSNIPSGTTILSVTNATTVTLSANATASGTNLGFSLGRCILNGGVNGVSLSVWLGTPAYLAAVVAANPDLIVASFGLNDVRLGLCDQATLRTRLINLVTTLKASVPNATIALRIPNAMLTTDVGGSHYVTDAQGNVNPAGVAQTYSSLIRQAYVSLIGRWPDVDVWDVQGDVLGTQSVSSSPMMSDQLHPTTSGGFYGSTPSPGSGYVAIADYLASKMGKREGAFLAAQPSSAGAWTKNGPAGSAYTTWQEFIIVGAGSTFIDLLNAAQYPISSTDTLYIQDWPSPLAMSAAQNIFRPQSGINCRIQFAGTDFSGFSGKRAWIGTTHPGPTTGDRQVVAIDLPSIAAGATVTQTVTVSGVRVGDVHDAAAVIAAPPAGFSSAGLLLLGAYPTANNTVTLVINNPTGGAVDRGSESWAFWVVR